MPVKINAKFWRSLKKEGACRVYYGKNGKEYRTARLVYEKKIGPIPSGKYVCHTCDRTGCVALRHLWLGTQKQNMADAIQKGRAVFPPIRHLPPAHPFPKGNKYALLGNGHKRFTLTQAKKIRKLHRHGVRQIDLMRRYQASKSCIYNILKRNTYV